MLQPASLCLPIEPITASWLLPHCNCKQRRIDIEKWRSRHLRAVGAARNKANSTDTASLSHMTRENRDGGFTRMMIRRGSRMTDSSAIPLPWFPDFFRE
jgi:hypothetical protein